jgi:hypothetical protein
MVAGWARARVAVAAAVALVTALGAPPAAAQDPGTPVDGSSQSVAPAAAGAAPRPDLGLVARRGDGGMNLLRMPLRSQVAGYGTPRLVRSLPASAGFSFDRARVVTRNFGQRSPPGDDGSADFVVWHAAGDGSVRMRAVAGGTDTSPKLWLTLRTPWSWADTRLTVGDIDGNGFDDVLVRHRARPSDRLWAFLSDGSRLAAPCRSGGNCSPTWTTTARTTW